MVRQFGFTIGRRGFRGGTYSKGFRLSVYSGGDEIRSII